MLNHLKKFTASSFLRITSSCVVFKLMLKIEKKMYQRSLWAFNSKKYLIPRAKKDRKLIKLDFQL